MRLHDLEEHAAAGFAGLWNNELEEYASVMNRLRALLTRLKGGPPTGPLTTREQTTADELRAETLAKDSDRIALEEKDKAADSDADA